MENKQKSSSCGIQFYVVQNEVTEEKIPHTVIHDILDGDGEISSDAIQKLTEYSSNFGSSFVSAVKKNMFSHINKLNSVRAILNSICENMISFYKENPDEFKSLSQFFDTDNQVQNKILSWNITKKCDIIFFRIWYKTVLILTMEYDLFNLNEKDRSINLDSITNEKDLLSFYKQLAIFSNSNLKEGSE